MLVRSPDVPVTAPALRQMAEEVTHAADALGSIRGLAWVWHESSAKDDAVAWFHDMAMKDISDEIAAYDGGPDRPVDAFIQQLRERVDENDLDEPSRQDALVQLTKLYEGWHTAPAILERARRLIRFAARMSESELCRGREQKEAVGAVQRAIQSYGEARDAIARGEPFDGLRKLRSIAQWVSLAAAKAGKACAAGQINLPTGGSSLAEDGLQPGDRASLASDPRRVGTVIEWRDAERVVWQEDGQTARAVLHPSKLRAAVDVDAAPSAPGRLVVVPMGGTPGTVDELLAVVTGHTSTFRSTPTAAAAKKWVKAALLHLGVEVVSMSAKTVGFDDVGGGVRVFVRVILPAQIQGDARVNRKLRLVEEALGRKDAPRISLEAWVYGPAEERTRAPARAPAAPAQASESSPDAAKDKALIDAFSAAVAAALTTP